MALLEFTIEPIFTNEGHLEPVIQDIRAKFEAAAAAVPSVLLIDELDSFSRRDEPAGNSILHDQPDQRTKAI